MGQSILESAGGRHLKGVSVDVGPSSESFRFPIHRVSKPEATPCGRSSVTVWLTGESMTDCSLFDHDDWIFDCLCFCIAVLPIDGGRVPWLGVFGGRVGECSV